MQAECQHKTLIIRSSFALVNNPDCNVCSRGRLYALFTSSGAVSKCLAASKSFTAIYCNYIYITPSYLQTPVGLHLLASIQQKLCVYSEAIPRDRSTSEAHSEDDLFSSKKNRATIRQQQH